LRKVYHREDPTNGNVDQDQSNLNGSTTMIIGTNSFSGVTNPGWKDQIRSGANATTPATGVAYTFEQQWFSSTGSGSSTLPPPNFYSVREDISGFHYLDTIQPVNPSAEQYAEVQNRAIRKFLEKAESVRSSVEAGQDLGEYKETIHGLVSPLSSLRDHVLSFFPSVKKHKGLKGRSLRKALADSYLEWTFGWKPLVSDIADAYVGLTNNSHPLIAPIEASASLDYSGKVDFWNITYPGVFAIARGSVRRTSRQQIRYKGAIRTGADRNGIIARGQLLQGDLPHFIPTLWDLLPYSFIVDYFTNVGDIIRAACFVTSNITWVAKTDRQIDRNQYAYGLDPQFFPSWFNANVPSVQPYSPWIQRVRFSRNPINPNSLMPTLQFHLPTSAKPWENIGAILASRAKSIGRFLT